MNLGSQIMSVCNSQDMRIRAIDQEINQLRNSTDPNASRRITELYKQRQQLQA